MNHQAIMHETPFGIMVRHYILHALTGGFHGSIMVCYEDSFEKNDAVTRPIQGFRESKTLGDMDAVLDYFKDEENKKQDDWVYFFRLSDGEMTKYKGELKNNHDELNLEEILDKHLPDDFMSLYGATKYDVGTKTGTSVVLPKKYPGIKNVIILKETGHGKVANLDEYGLIEEFYLVPEAEGTTGPFIDAKNGIKGIYKCYRNRDGKPNRDENGKLVPSRQGAVDIYLEDSKGMRLGPYRKPEPMRQRHEKVIHAAPLAVLPSYPS